MSHELEVSFVSSSYPGDFPRSWLKSRGRKDHECVLSDIDIAQWVKSKVHGEIADHGKIFALKERVLKNSPKLTQNFACMDL